MLNYIATTVIKNKEKCYLYVYVTKDKGVLVKLLYAYKHSYSSSEKLNNDLIFSTNFEFCKKEDGTVNTTEAVTCFTEVINDIDKYVKISEINKKFIDTLRYMIVNNISTEGSIFID